MAGGARVSKSVGSAGDGVGGLGGFASAALICRYVTLALLVGVAGTIAVHLLWRGTGAREITVCQTNAARVGQAVRAYAMDYDGDLPCRTLKREPHGPRGDWVARVGCAGVRCPACRDVRAFAPYALHWDLGNLDAVAAPERTLLIADGSFTMRGPADLAYRHVNDGVVGCFVDGHVEYIAHARHRFDDRLRLVDYADGEDTP